MAKVVEAEAVEPAPPALTGMVDDEALRGLYDVHSSPLLGYLLRLTNGDRHRAEDIVQETLLRAWQRPEARAPDGTWRRGWLFTVARNLAIDHFRSARPTEQIVEQPDPANHMDQVLDAREVRAAIASLPDRLRVVLVEVYLRDRTGAEAAEALGIPEGTVKSRTFYALRALRETLAAREYPLP